MKTRTRPFWSVVNLVRDSYAVGSPSIMLENINSGTGTLRADIPDRDVKKSGKPFQQGDVLFGKLRPYLAKSWNATWDGIAVGDIHVYRPYDNTDSRFLSYVVQSSDFVKFAENHSYGTKMPRCEWSSICSYQLADMALETQERIADYLDEETSRIDNTVSTLDELIEEMKSRRVQLIQESFSSSDSYVGSCEFAEINPSSHEGMVDQEFEQAPIGTIARVTLGKMVKSNPSKKETVSLPYLHAANVRDFGILDVEHSHRTMWFSPSEVEHLRIEAGDVVVVEGGAVGKSAYIKADLEGYGFQNSILRIRADEQRSNGRFIQHCLQAAFDSGTIARECSSVSLAHFPAEKVGRFRIPLPPLETQRRIADYLDAETAKIDKIISTATELRSELLERRSALITEVVTGKKKI